MFIILTGEIFAAQLKSAWSNDSNVSVITVDTNQTFTVDVWITGNTEQVNGAAVFLDFPLDLSLKSVILSK